MAIPVVESWVQWAEAHLDQVLYDPLRVSLTLILTRRQACRTPPLYMGSNMHSRWANHRCQDAVPRRQAYSVLRTQTQALGEEGDSGEA